jgi:single-stranded DNA-binding protein
MIRHRAPLRTFDTHAVDTLLQLSKGDAVAVSGTAKLTRWKGKDGIEHTGMSVTAHNVMTAYTATKKRRTQADERTTSMAGE